MEKIIPIVSNYPNQDISFTEDGNNINVAIYIRNNLFYGNVTINGLKVSIGVPLINNNPINIYPSNIPFKGRIFMRNSNIDENITLENLGVTSFLYYSN